MWLPEKAAERIRELEGQLRDSVPLVVYQLALDRIAEQERRIDWQSDMLLRRGQSFPLPPKPELTPDQPEPKRQVTEGDRARAQVVIDQGKAMRLPEQEIVEAVHSLNLNWTEADIAAAIRGPSNGHLTAE